MSDESKRTKEYNKNRFKTMGAHEEFLNRISKTLYYGKLPVTERLSLPVTELASEIFSECQYGLSLNRLHYETAATISRNACVSPCSFVMAMIYLERLKTRNPEYLQKIAPSELFLISLMISSKFLHDDGEEDEVFADEWATSAGLTVKEITRLEKEFLNAIEWEVFVNENLFWERLKNLETKIALRQGMSRGGWFTYTDLLWLLDNVEVYNLFQIVFTVTSVLLTTYTASIMTIISSVLIASHIPGTALNKHMTDLQTSSSIEPLSVVNKIETNETVHDDLSEFIMNDINEFKKSININNNDNVSLPSINVPKITIDPVNVLTTSIILASLTTGSNNCTSDLKNEDLNSTEINLPSFIGWDWWTSDLMNWLYEKSAQDTVPDNYNNKYADDSKTFDYCKRIDMSIANCKLLGLEDQISKATSTRIQDQIESSWHIEWTDTIANNIYKPENYIPIIYSGKAY